jgi:alpha-1,6-mannosyltransferase
MHSASRRVSRLTMLGLLLIAAVLFGIFHYLALLVPLSSHVPEFVALMLVAGALYLAGVYLVEMRARGVTTLFIVLGAGMAFRLALLPVAPSLSDDVYRYQWEGRIQRARLNPYLAVPAAPGLRHFQDSAHPIESGKLTSTLYPPLSELSFSWIRTVCGYKWFYTACDLASLLLLLLLLAARGQPLERALIYAWNPTVIVAFALSGHHDSLAILTLLAACLFIIEGWPRLSIAFLALAFLAKFFPALLLPGFLKKTRRAYVWIFAALLALGYLPFVSAGRRLFAGLGRYARHWENNDSLFRLLLWAGNSKTQAELVAGALLLALLAYALKKRLDPLRAALLLFAGLLALSPNAFPWYFTWTIPFLCFYPDTAWLLMSVTCALGYAPVAAYAAGQPYLDSPLILALEYAPVFALLVWEAWRSLRRPAPEFPPGYFDLHPPRVENA